MRALMKAVTAAWPELMTALGAAMATGFALLAAFFAGLILAVLAEPPVVIEMPPPPNLWAFEIIEHAPGGAITHRARDPEGYATILAGIAGDEVFADTDEESP